MSDQNDTRNFPAKFYDEINNVIGGNNPNEKLVLLLPGIALTKNDFAYDYKKNEPKGPVIEANESRLANKLYDLAELVGSDNGKTLEHQYKSALDMLTPKVNPILAKAKNQLRDLLMKPFPYKFGPKIIKRAEILEGTVLKAPPPDPEQKQQSNDKEEYSFQEVFFRLYNDYVEQLGEWANERQRRKEYYQALAQKEDLKNDSERNKWFENQYLQWYEDNAEVWLTAVDQKMSVLLSVFSDNDMKIIEGILDSGFGAELQEARQTLRNCRKINPDGGYIYPVKFNPTNWFEYLDTSFTPVDLLNSPAAIITQLKLLYKKQNFFNQRICDVAKQIKIENQTLPELQKKLNAAKAEYEQCDLDLQQAVQTSFTEFAKFAATTICKIKFPPEVVADEITDIAEGEVRTKLSGKSIKEDLKKDELKKAYEELVQKNADGQDPTNTLQTAIEQMDQSQQDNKEKKDLSKIVNTTLKSDFKIADSVTEGLNILVEGTSRVNLAQHLYLKSIQNITHELTGNIEHNTQYESLINELSTLQAQKQDIESDIKDLEDRLGGISAKNMKKIFSEVTAPPVVPDGFMQFTISHKMNSNQKTTLSTSSSSTSSVDTGVWIFRETTRHTQSQSSAQSEFCNSSCSIEIGMNVAKVEIEREWFNPGIFALTEEMYSVGGDVKIANYENKEKARIPSGTGVFPCYTTAMVIARDVSIRMISDSSSSFTKQDEFSSECANSGSFFVFNSGNGSSSHVSSGESSSTSNASVITIRFTTPQIIGFYQQIIPEDKSDPYPQSSGDETQDKNDSDNIVKFIQAYEDVINARNKNDDNNPKHKEDDPQEK